MHEPLWAQRLAEQQSWPERTDPDALLGAFDALERAGIVARPDFTWCSTCGHAEIGAEVTADSRGYAFFHRQATEAVAENGWLHLLYGACGSDRSRDAMIGREIADAVTAAGLPVTWDGDGTRAVRVGPIRWLRRLPEADRT